MTWVYTGLIIGYLYVLINDYFAPPKQDMRMSSMMGWLSALINALVILSMQII